MQNKFNFLKEDMFIVYDKTNYVHWVLCVILVMALLVCWFSKKIIFEGLQEDNPTIQYTTNPVISMIDKLGGTKWYPQDNPRRVDSIMDPMTESKLYKLIYP